MKELDNVMITDEDENSEKIKKLISERKCSQEEFEKLLIENQNFPYSIVNKEYSKYPYNIKQELNSAAIHGMVHAAMKYDPARASECKFISFAVHWIRWYIYDEIRKLFPVKFNQNFICKRNKVLKCISDYKESHDGCEPTIEYISNEVKMSKKVVTNILNINGGKNFQFLSFNMPSESEKTGTESESVTNDKLVKEYLDDAVIKNPSISLEFKDMMEYLKNKLDPKEFNIFSDYYINGESYSNLAKKYKLNFPASAEYIIKKCEKEARKVWLAD